MFTMRSSSIIAWMMAALFFTGACRGREASISRLVGRGDAFAQSGRHAEAILEYQNALKIDQKRGEIRKKLAKVYLDGGDPALARQEFARAADLLPDDLEVHITAGGLRLLARQYTDALGLADRVLKTHPTHVPALVLRANALAGINDLETAISQIEEAIRLDPSVSELYSNLGSMQAHSGQVAVAEAAYKQAISVDPKSVTALAALANFYWATRRPVEAEATFKRAIALEPANPVANTALATFYLASGRRPEAGPHLKAVAESGPAIGPKLRLADYYLLSDRPAEGVRMLEEVAKIPGAASPARTRLAAAAYASGRKDEALRLVDEVLAADKQNPQALFLKARFLARDLKNDEALELARAATDADPAMIQAHFLIGQLSAAKRQYDFAATAYKRVLEINPLASAANLELAKLQLVFGSSETSVQFAESAVRNAPNDPAARTVLVRALIEHRDLVQAEEELRPLAAAFPEAATVDVLTGTLSFVKRDFPAARRSFERALKRQPTSLDALSGLIGVDIAMGKPADARARIEAELAKTPKRTAILLLAARTYGAIRDLPQAEATLHRAIDGDPASLEAYGMLGQLYYEQGRLEEGRREFERLVEKQPNAVAAHTMLAIILRRQGQTDKAIERYRQVLAIDPQAAVAANNLAWIYAEQDRFLPDAVGLARTAKKLLPNSPEVADTLGWLYHKTHVPSLAVAYLQESVDKDPRNPVYRYHLGAALTKAGQADKARVELQQALALNPDFPGASDARSILLALK